MADFLAYSPYFHTLYDQPEPMGNLGRGTHYSVLTAPTWVDEIQAPMNEPCNHRFCVIWDEDHDNRVITAIEWLYVNKFLTPVRFIGERKGGLYVLLSSEAYAKLEASGLSLGIYTDELEHAIEQITGDYWPVTISWYSQNSQEFQDAELGIINDSRDSVMKYLWGIDAQFQLGLHECRIRHIE